MNSKRTLIIPGRLSGLNEYTAACRSHRQVGAKMKKENQDVVELCILAQLRGVHYDAPVRLDIRWYEPNKRRDLDNVAFAKKFIQDALVSTGVIQSDGWNGISGFSDTFYVDKSDPRIEVDIDYDDSLLPI